MQDSPLEKAGQIGRVLSCFTSLSNIIFSSTPKCWRQEGAKTSADLSLSCIIVYTKKDKPSALKMLHH